MAEPLYYVTLDGRFHHAAPKAEIDAFVSSMEANDWAANRFRVDLVAVAVTRNGVVVDVAASKSDALGAIDARMIAHLLDPREQQRYERARRANETIEQTITRFVRPQYSTNP